MAGNRSSQIIIASRYKPCEVVQLPALMTRWGSLGKKILKERVGESKIEEWSKRVLNETRQSFCKWEIGNLEEKGLSRKT